MEADPPVELGYSTLPRRRRWKRWVLVVVVVVAAAAGFRHYAWPVLSARLQMISEQRSLAAYTPKRQVALRTPEQWKFLERRFWPFGWKTVYAGFRRDSSGRERIVVVFSLPVPNPKTLLTFESISLEPGTLLRSESTVPGGTSTLEVPMTGWHPDVYFGQPDPADPARFTIDSADAPAPFTIDCHLNPDGTVAMKYLQRPGRD
jgi:hypothetical protein